MPEYKRLAEQCPPDRLKAQECRHCGERPHPLCSSAKFHDTVEVRRVVRRQNGRNGKTFIVID